MREKNDVQQNCTGPEVMVPGSLRVYRSWSIEVLDLFRTDSSAIGLRGHAGHIWTDALIRAWCRHGCAVLHEGGCTCQCAQDLVPNIECTCGFYGFHSLETMLDDRHMRRWSSTCWSNSLVLGTVRFSGKMLIGTKGVRAQYAQLESLVSFADYGVVTSLRRKFDGLPVFTDRCQWLDMFPSESVEELIK